MKYTDIGHAHHNDILWIILEDGFQFIPAGLSRTHELVWGGEARIEDCWRGRYDHLSWRCSIAPSEECRELLEPPDSLIEKLRERFETVSAFYYFGNNNDDVEPMNFSLEKEQDAE